MQRKCRQPKTLLRHSLMALGGAPGRPVRLQQCAWLAGTQGAWGRPPLRLSLCRCSCCPIAGRTQLLAALQGPSIRGQQLPERLLALPLVQLAPCHRSLGVLRCSQHPTDVAWATSAPGLRQAQADMKRRLATSVKVITWVNPCMLPYTAVVEPGAASCSLTALSCDLVRPLKLLTRSCS
jgi:hypothetical protein